ncbi:MAG TPA: DUF6206 family protein [Desulfosalsimonadaceae bacterium]|nr:DUF6206 family protein [Desulfosalsimonadaceae bacterium]
MIPIDARLLTDFENGLNPAVPEKSRMPPTILGYGEISSTFMIPQMPGVALKRMPPFDSAASVASHKSIVDRYCRALAEKCQIRVPGYDFFDLINQSNEHILYIAQEQLPEAGMGHFLLRRLETDGLTAMLESVLGKLVNIWRWNDNPERNLTLGLDAQISNWHFDFVEQIGLSDPVYFDVTTPLMRIGGREQLDPEIFLKSCPGFLVWLVRWQFLDEVLDRYYDLRQVVIDLVANFNKEGAAQRIPEALSIVNRYLSTYAQDLAVDPITESEVQTYYKNDAFIWGLFLTLRRLDRFVTTKVRRKRYNFILPGKIQR